MINILVADDSASDRLIIKNMLSEYSILTANDGVEAMRQLKENEQINLLILDLNMPNMNGFEVLEALKTDGRYKHVRTIILTNYDEIDNEIKGLKLGAVDYIRKPIHMDSLKARIDIHAELIHAQRALEQKLDEQTLSFDVIFEKAPIGIAISHSNDPQHTDETILKINSMFEQITGRTKEELINSGWAKMTHPDDLEIDLENFKKLQAGIISNYSIEKRIIRPDGSVAWLNVTVAALAHTGDNTYNYMCLIQDISESKKIEDERKYIFEHDRMTGLYNREYLNIILERDARQAKAVKRALVGVNLSKVQFMTVNYGYNYTQVFLVKVAEILKGYSTCDRMLFRTHENRFLFYVKNYKDKNELLDFAETIASALEALFETDRVGGGIGILEFDKNESDTNLLSRKLLIASEKAMSIFDKEFRACFYDEALEALVDRELEIRQELSRISADNTSQNLCLLYQPIFDLRSNSICGFEALARLQTDKLGLVSPLEFIPIAEETKLIIPIGEQILIKAFRFLQRLKALGFHFVTVAVNVSAIQLLRPDFPDKLLQLIKEMRVDANNICIEITESIFAYDYALINRIIGRLKDEGLYVAIDDFGTGYSSLAREKELNVNCLKIDKSFIKRLSEEDNDKTITGDIITIAHRLGHCTIAEGVENNEQKQYLITHECDKIQGYLVSRPIDEEAAIELLKNQPQTVSCRLPEFAGTAVSDNAQAKAVETVSEREDTLQLILSCATEAIFGIDVNGNCTFCSASCVKMLGYGDRSELLEKNMYSLIHHSKRDGSPLPAEESKILNALKYGGCTRGDDEVFWRADGTCFDVEYYTHPQIKDGKTVGAVVTFTDISEQRQKEARMQYRIYHDMLTGLYNRRYFEEILLSIDDPKNLPLSVIYADINALKITNDIFGHSAGDELIKLASDTMRQVCEENGTVARIGGDEFIMLLPNTTREKAGEIASRIISSLEDVSVEAIRCSLSLGLDTKQSPDQSLEVMMANAENAMYRQKTMNRKSVKKDILETIIETLDTKDRKIKQHSIAVSKLCSDIGSVMLLQEAEINKLMRAAYLHDIGKIVLDESILSKDELSEEEHEKMRQHSVVGYRILNLFDDTLDLAEIVYGHHERWDGTGYPRGLIGEQIPLLSRIIAVAESYDYVKGKGELPLKERRAAAIDDIKNGAGTKFDPKIAMLFADMIKNNEEI